MSIARFSLNLGLRLLFLAATLATLGIGLVPPAHALGLSSIVLKGGLGVSWMSEDIEILKPKTLRSFCGGASIEVPLNPRYSFQPELLYAVQGFSYGISDATDDTGAPVGTFETLREIRYLEIPLLLRSNVGSPGGAALHLLGGPVVQVEVGEKFLTRGAIEGSQDTDVFKDTDLGVMVGAGLEFGISSVRWTVEARQSIGLTNLSRLDPVTFRNRSFQLMAGARFGIGR